MSVQEKTREVIKRLKIVKEDRGLSLQNIVDMTEANNKAVSMSTVRRIFEEGSEDRNFRYEDSVKPIADVLLNAEGLPGTTSADAAELEALRALVRYKNSYIAELEAGAANMEKKIAAAVAKEHEKVAYLKEQIAMKDQQIADRGRLLDERRDFLRRKDRTIALLASLLAFCLLFIIGALIVDSINPDVGFFWLDDMAAFVRGVLHSGPGAANGIRI